MTIRDMSNNEAIEMLNRCKHEIIQMREVINQLRPKADAYDNISTIIQIFFVRPSEMVSNDIIWAIQKRLDELTPKPETNPTPAPKQSKPNLDELNKMKAQANSIQQFGQPIDAE